MNQNENIITNSNSHCLKRKNRKNAIRKLNPDIFHFNKKNSFIYEPVYSNIYYQRLLNKNIMKLTNNEIFYLQDLSNNNKEYKNRVINVFPFFKEFMDNVYETKPILDNRDILIQKLIKSSPVNYNISIEKITNKFNEIAEKEGLQKIKKSTTHKIFRKKLLLNFRKRIIKNSKLKKPNYIRFCFFFIKIFFRAINQGLKPIYIDESGFSLKNNNYKTWVFNNENIYFGSNLTGKVNLILAVSDKKKIHFKITKENTTSLIFKNFILEIVKKIFTEGNNENFFLVMDNFKGHLTQELFELYKEKNLKVLFGVPYASQFNMAEYAFRALKNYTYKKLYSSIEILMKDIEEILITNLSSSLLEKLFHHTIKEYLKFIEEYKNYNLN